MGEVIYRQSGRDAHYKVWHKSEQGMFLLIHAGSGSIVSREKNYPMGKATLCFIGSNQYHYTFPNVSEQYIRSKLFVSASEFEKIFHLLSPHCDLQQLLAERRIAIGALGEREARRAEEIFEELSRLSVSSDYFQPTFYAAVLNLTVLLARSGKKNPPQRFEPIQIAVEYMNRHITEDISIDEICAVCHLSKYHFCRLFKKKIGLTVMRYILKTRIAMAKELLCDGTMSITEVSAACAFSSVSYFSRVFKTETGMTPLQYKNSNSRKHDCIDEMRN